METPVVTLRTLGVPDDMLKTPAYIILIINIFFSGLKVYFRSDVEGSGGLPLRKVGFQLPKSVYFGE